MQRTPVVSSNVVSIGYGVESRILEVEYSSGGVYQYSNVPPEIARDVLNAPSIGKYLNQYVKKLYVCVKL
jgi:hypothetical protein